MTLAGTARKWRWIVAGLFYVTISCRQVPVVKVPATDFVQIRQEPINLPTDSSDAIYGSLSHSGAVFKFYAYRDFQPAWMTDSTAALADSLFHIINEIRFYGLLPQKYHLNELKTFHGPISNESICRKEVLLTDSFLSLASDLRKGRLNSFAGSGYDSLNLEILGKVFYSGEVKKVLEAVEPTYPQYRLLKKSLYQILHECDSVDYETLLAGITYDNREIHRKVRTLEINMERWRNTMINVEQKHVWINIPSFQLQLMDSGKTVLESRIIVGKPESPTPVFTSLIECIILYPYWHVPRKIAIEEYLPEIQLDTSFLTRNNFDVLDRKGNVLNPATIDWQRYSSVFFPVRLRQREGDENSLGVIKFMFDNPYAVFLHDTNIRSLFRKKVRMFSHGCIRMEKALELAKYLSPDPAKIDLKLSLRERHSINLPHPMPIYIQYITSEYIHDGLDFYDDIYGLDSILIPVLYGEFHVPD